MISTAVERHTARKNHVCTWCGEAINAGESYQRYRWFGSDGVMMQQLFDSEPDYEETKLYSPEAKDLMAFIREDKAVVAVEMELRRDM